MKQNLFLILVLLLPVMAAWAVDRYVATNGAHDTVGGYTNWAGAATNIQAAVDVATTAGDYVWVSNGVYTTTTGVFAHETNCIVVLTNKAITLKSMNGPSVTVIDGNYPSQKVRCVYMDSGSILDGFAVRNGYVDHSPDVIAGSGVMVWGKEGSGGGHLTNCIIHNNYSRNRGGGIANFAALMYMDNCAIYSNTAEKGGGMWNNWMAEGSRIDNCVFWGNTAQTAWDTQGGGMWSWNSKVLIRNCLFYRNSSTRYWAGGIYMGGTEYCAIIDNCTIISNSAGGGLELGGQYGGFYCSNTTATVNPARNLIIWGNTASSSYPDAYTEGYSFLTHCCIGDTNGVPNWNTSGNITNNPQFVDAAGYNYRLSTNSPCINTGTNRIDWMLTGFDLDGRRRIIYSIVDMGAYEHLRE